MADATRTRISKQSEASSSSAASYDMTAGGGGEGGGDGLPAPALPPAHHDLQQNKRKRRISHISNEYNAMPHCEEPHRASPAPLAPPSAPPPRQQASSTRRQKNSSTMVINSAYDEETEECRAARMHPDRKQNHSEIEKRRRDKMNTYITELSALIPMCNAMSRKLDKLTVLRMAVQHMRTVRGTLSTCPLTSCPRPSYVTERELNDLVLAVGGNAFVIVVGCDRGRLLYLSDSIEALLLYDKSELIGQSLFDILHPKDVAKVKEQLSSLDLTPRERLIDAKTMQPVMTDTGESASRLCPGARRSFFCRIKARPPTEPEAPGALVKQETEPPAKVTKKSERKYCVVQCTGYLKSWAPSEMSTGGGGAGVEGAEEEATNVPCLVAVGRALHHMVPPTSSEPALQPAPPNPHTRKLQFLSRHTNDGKYVFVDQRVTMALGYLPQEMLGTSLYEYVSGPDLGAVARAHKTTLIRRDALVTPPYTVRRKDGSHVLLQTRFKPFRNPWTKDVECLVAENVVVTDSSTNQEYNELNGAADGDAELQQLIDSQVGSHKIGSAIAEDALRRSPAGLSLDLPPELMHDALFNNSALVDSMVTDDAPQSHHQVPPLEPPPYSSIILLFPPPLPPSPPPPPQLHNSLLTLPLPPLPPCPLPTPLPTPQLLRTLPSLPLSPLPELQWSSLTPPLPHLPPCPPPTPSPPPQLQGTLPSLPLSPSLTPSPLPELQWSSLTPPLPPLPPCPPPTPFPPPQLQGTLPPLHLSPSLTPSPLPELQWSVLTSPLPPLPPCPPPTPSPPLRLQETLPPLPLSLPIYPPLPPSPLPPCPPPMPFPPRLQGTLPPLPLSLPIYPPLPPSPLPPCPPPTPFPPRLQGTLPLLPLSHPIYPLLPPSPLPPCPPLTPSPPPRLQETLPPLPLSPCHTLPDRRCLSCHYYLRRCPHCHLVSCHSLFFNRNCRGHYFLCPYCHRYILPYPHRQRYICSGHY